MENNGLYENEGFVQVMELYGGEEFACEVIGMVSEDTLKNLDLMKEALEKEDYTNYKIYAHGIKGMMASLFQEDLKEYSLKHEMAAKEGRYDYIKEDFEAYDKTCRDFCTYCKELLSNL
ncbi:MAG: hypothetical protein K6B28_13620 [Lachnospiraceae bacterium]|nr:hypothetical protein [Lachnospiraceae bacterium]